MAEITLDGLATKVDQMQVTLGGLVDDIDQLAAVVNGDPDRDVPGLRKQSRENTEGVDKLNQQWRGFRILMAGIGLGLMVSQGSILVVLSQILSKLGALP